MLLIKGARVADGLGNPLEVRDVVASEDGIRLVPTGQTDGFAGEVIEAEGLVLAPGFIDIHAHNDLVTVSGVELFDKILQGVTTEVNGNCGFSPFPITALNRHVQPELLSVLAPGAWSADWESWKGYAQVVSRLGMPNNLVGQVGHGALRSAAMGMDLRAPTDAELCIMTDLLSQNLEEGASGLSFGLMYSPSGFAERLELEALARTVAAHDGFISIHLRSYSRDSLLSCMEEIIAVAKAVGVRLQLSHLSPTGEGSSALTEPMLEMVEQARRDGVDLAFDRYPYEEAFTEIALLLPRASMEGGEAELLRRIGSDEHRPAIVQHVNEFAAQFGFDAITLVGERYGARNGRTLADLATETAVSGGEVICRLCLEFGSAGPITIRLSEMAVQERVLRHDLCMVGSDGVPCTGGTHPRTFGTFARVIGPMVRRGVLDLPTAIHKMTGQPACWLGLEDRGVIKEGGVADLVLFDPEIISDKSTFANPYEPPRGIKLVVVNGVVVVRDGVVAGAKPGLVLAPRRRSHQA